MVKPTTEARFDSWIERTPTCWEWTGPTSPNSSGARYGLFWTGSGYTGAHRYAYERIYGKLPDGAQVHHWCLNKLCVRPDHLGCAHSQSEHIAMEKEARGQLSLLLSLPELIAIDDGPWT